MAVSVQSIVLQGLTRQRIGNVACLCREMVVVVTTMECIGAKGWMGDCVRQIMARPVSKKTNAAFAYNNHDDTTLV